MRVEIPGSLIGLQLGWNQGHRKIKLRLDSTTIIHILMTKEKRIGGTTISRSDLGSSCNEIGRLKSLLLLEWATKQHITYPIRLIR
ncbi:unnamed protein product [Linum tenue]|uniref:RNase H type-1 domain-containing protein n=1 Tax=Linum tenue TaxID=586396 RepID=A0AAV0P0I2_9ROSI|nr:unnamed protein product [Linum tenue]